MDAPSQAPDGFLRLGPLLHAALDPACRPNIVVERRKLPSFRVLLDLVREEMDCGGPGTRALLELGIATGLAVQHLLREAGGQVGKTAQQLVEALADAVSADVDNVLTAVCEPDTDALVNPIQEAADDAGRLVDLVGDLADVAALLAHAVALHEDHRQPRRRPTAGRRLPQRGLTRSVMQGPSPRA